MRALGRFLIGQSALLVFLVSVPWVFLVATPGVLGLTGPLLCPDDQRDVHVVEYHTETSDGTGTSYTLVCMGPDGDLTEVGSWKPLGVVFGALLLGLEALVLPIQLLGIVRRRRRRTRPGPAPFPPPSPFPNPFDQGPPGRSGRRIRFGSGIGR